MNKKTLPPMDEPTPHEKLPLNPINEPKKHKLGAGDDELHVGSQVFYRGERYWVTNVPKSWAETHHIRISDKTPRPGAPEDTAAAAFKVPADSVDLAPPTRGKKPPTIRSIAQAVRAKNGQKDIGDDLAGKLRDMTLGEIFEYAARVLGEACDGLHTKYAHLDNGRKRMVLGNRLRAFFKKQGA